MRGFLTISVSVKSKTKIWIKPDLLFLRRLLDYAFADFFERAGVGFFLKIVKLIDHDGK